MRAKSSAYRSKRTTNCPNIGGASPSKAFSRFSRPLAIYQEAKHERAKGASLLHSDAVEESGCEPLL
jgi:hypothetical protein